MDSNHKRGFFWVTFALFIGSVIAHWTFALTSGETPTQVLAAMFENWQSEFLQLIWQVVGLALFLYIGSPQSKEGQDRIEEKIDKILDATRPADSAHVRKEIEEKYPKG